jgi:hypothetical protein
VVAVGSAVRTGTRLRALLIRLVVTAGLMVAAWLISSLMAGSASASTSSGHADADTDATSSSDSGLLGGLLGGLTQTVGDVLGGGSDAVHGLTGDHESDSDATHRPDPNTDADTGESTADTTLPGLFSGGSSAGGSYGSGTASTMPAEPVEQQSSEPVSTPNESRPAVQVAKAKTHRSHVDSASRSTPKRAAGHDADRPAAKSKQADPDNSRRAKEPLPFAPLAPQAPVAPSAAIGASHDTTTHGKSWFLAAAGDATLTPPTATGSAIDHRATAFARDRDRPATAPD